MAHRSKLMSVAALLLASAPAFSQVYKCQEGGRIVITDQPCLGAEQMTVRPAAGPLDPRAAAAARARVTAAEEESKARRIERELDDLRRAAARTPDEPDECDRLRQDHTDAKYWQGEFRHPDNIAREKAKREKAASDSFFKCGPGKRVSVFDE